MEEWRDIPGYEGKYQVSNNGNVRSLYHRSKQRIKLLKTTAHHKGYKVISLCPINGCPRKWYQVHRLVAMAFIPNQNNKPEINHKDGNKHNNSVSNLEWVTYSENTVHGWANGLMKSHGKKVAQFTLDNSFLRTIESAAKADRLLHLSPGSISDCCSGKQKTAGGYKWRYMN